MKRSIEQALVDASDALEHLLDNLSSLSLQERIDIAARLKTVADGCSSVDEAVKGEVKKRLKGRAGEVRGVSFKAVVSVVPTECFLSKTLKENDPETYDHYVVTNDVVRATFRPR